MLLLFVTVLLTAPPLRAQDVRASLTLDSASYAIGAWIHGVLTVDAPQGWRIVLPVDSADAVHTTIVSGEAEEKYADAGRDRIVKKYVLTCFDTGTVVLSLRVRYRTPGDTTLHVAESAPVTIAVRSMPVDTSKAYLDIKDVAGVPLTLWEILAYGGIMLLVLAALWYALRRSLRQPVVEAPVLVRSTILPAYDMALEKLRALEKEKVWERGEHKAYQSTLTEILREYIERRYQVPALEQVTAEIVRSVAMMGVEPDVMVKLEQMLRIADMAKFATYTPGANEHVLGLRIAYEFLEHTKPEQPEEPEVIEERASPVATGIAQGAPESNGTVQAGDAPAGGERRDV